MCMYSAAFISEKVWKLSPGTFLFVVGFIVKDSRQVTR